VLLLTHQQSIFPSQVLSLPKLLHLSDASLKILGKYCHDLASLNVSRSGQFTDAGLKKLLKGCPALQSLNIAGSLGVTEKGLGYIAAGAPNLGTLNITGCQDITANGLRAAIEGNGYVLEARAFFGFYPKADRVDTKLADEQVWLETKAARIIQVFVHGFKNGQAEKDFRIQACVQFSSLPATVKVSQRLAFFTAFFFLIPPMNVHVYTGHLVAV
jgi:hypothetical protein